MSLERSTHSILVVDDAESNRYAVSRALRAAGYQTVEAAAGAQALELAEYVEAVVLDVHLPDLHGFEVCRLLRANPKTARVPVIHISAVYVTDEDRAAGERAGADAYMVSPVDTDELASTIDRLVQDRAGA
ncbi:MAG: hybrid sensor histidine kinase/response regulator [Ramlibacter sp.]|jgi:CheY-like chemotaxis protein|nr:hybrid sensor histidine kinase/response regulator [Ramlibacter sp.]